MILSLLHLVLISVLLLAPTFLFKNRSSRMMNFYLRMTHSEYCQKFYAQVLLLLVILFHFVYYWMRPGEYGVMVSTILIIYMFSSKRTLAMLRGIRDSRGVMVFVFILCLALLFTPHMYSLGVTLGYILMASAFLPSKRVVRDPEEIKEYSSYEEYQEDTIQKYYS